MFLQIFSALLGITPIEHIEYRIDLTLDDLEIVVFDVPGKGLVKEADVVRCKNGASVNFVEDYMRRREPDCMRIADDKPTDKKRFADVYGYKFDKLRRETMDWFKTQELSAV